VTTRDAVHIADANVHAKRVKWLGLTNGDDGTPIGGGPVTGKSISLDHFQDRCVQVIGTFGSGGSISIQGSNDGGTTWVTLTDPLGNALTFTSAGMKQITELPHMLKPIVTAGDGTTSLAVWLHMRGAER
jgi:hypothetical protein